MLIVYTLFCKIWNYFDFLNALNLLLIDDDITAALSYIFLILGFCPFYLSINFNSYCVYEFIFIYYKI